MADSSYYAKKKKEQEEKIKAAMKARETRNTSQSKPSTTSNTTSSTSSKNSYYAEKKQQMDSRIQTALSSRRTRIQRTLPDTISDIQSRFNSEVASYNKTSKPSFGSYDQTYSSQLDRRYSINSLRDDVLAYRSYLGVDVTDNLISALDTMKNGYDYYLEMSKFKNEDEYDKWRIGWLNPNAETTAETVSARQERQKQNATDLDALKSEYEAEQRNNTSIQQKIVGYSRGGMMSAQQKKALQDEKSASDKKLKDLKTKIESLTAENNMYSRTQGWADSYYDITSKPGFGTSNRDYANPTREEMDTYDIRINSAYTTDADGVTRDVFGEVFDDTYYDRVKQPEVVDKLGIYLSADESTRLEAYADMAGAEGTWATIIKDGDYANWDKLKPNEIETYYWLLQNQGQEDAYKYLDGMTTELNRRATTERTEMIAEASPVEKFVLNLASIPASVYGGTVSFVDDAIKTVKGEDINPYNQAHSLQNFGQDVRSATAEDLNELTHNAEFLWMTLGDTYQAVMSGADSFVGATTIGRGYTAFMGMGAASAEARELYEKGASKGQIAWGGVLAGAAEALFEYVSLDHFLKLKDANSIKQLAKNILLQGGVEASEEVFTEIANTISDAIVMGSQSEWQTAIQNYKEQGYSDAEATALALMDVGKNVWKAGMGGFISGGGMGAIGSTISYANYNSEAKQTGKYIQQNGDVDALKALALDMAGVSENQALAKQANKVTAESKAKAIGKLALETESAIESYNSKDGIVKAMVEKGMSEAEAKSTADRILKTIEDGGEFTDAEIELMEGDNAFSAGIEAAYAAKGKPIQLAKAMTQKKSHTKMSNTGQNSTIGKSQLDLAKAVSENAYDVSAEGKTIVKDSTGNSRDVKIQSIYSISDGKMVLKLDDNSTVDSTDVSYASSDDAIVYSAIANMGLDVTSANAVLKAWNDSNGAVSGQTFALGMMEGIRYGAINYAEESISSNGFYADLDPVMKNTARRIGETIAMADVNAKQDNIYKAKRIARTALKKSGKAKAEGRVYFEQNGKRSEDISSLNLTERQAASVEGIKFWSKILGIDIVLYDSLKPVSGKRISANGWFDPDTNTIHLDINAGANYDGQMMYTMSHELTHFIRQWSPAKFKVFADFLIDQYGKKGVSANQLVMDQIRKAKSNGRSITWDTAYEEVVADSCMQMLNDPSAYKALAELKQKDKTLWQKIKDFISDLIAKLKQTYEGVTPDSYEAQLVAEKMKDVADQLHTLFNDALLDAGESYQTIRSAFGNDAIIEVNENGEFVSVRARAGTDISKPNAYNLTTWDEGARDSLEAALTVEGYSTDEVNAALTIMDAKRELAEKLGKEFSEQDRVNRITLTNDLKNGRPVLSALVSNGDYPVNIDLLMVCKKRLAYQRVINRLCETGLIENATLDSLAIAEINKILGKHGFETACYGCFVESRRLRIQEWANTICNEWNSIVDKFVGKGKAQNFNFAKDTFVKDLDDGYIQKLSTELENADLHYGKETVVKKMEKLLREVPALRKHLSVADLITPQGRTKLRSLSSELNSLVACRYGSNTPKMVQDINPYNAELAKYNKYPQKYKSLREYLYAIGGARMQSFSDFIIENWFDYCQIVADLSARKLPMHTYTKEISLVKLLGMTGIKVNMSLIPDLDMTLESKIGFEEAKSHAGLTLNENGEWELIFADKDRNKATGGKSYMQSINFADAIALQNDPRYSANVGTIAVGVSEAQIRMMLNDPRIRMVIPYHASGMNPIFADMVGTKYYNDFTDYQNTTVKYLVDENGKKVNPKLTKAQRDNLTKGFEFNETLQELGDARATAQAYLDWCADASQHSITVKGKTYNAVLTPKFEMFSTETNYYKVLEDFNCYDCITEEAAPQGDVTQTYPEDFEDILRSELKAQQKYRAKTDPNFDSAMAEISEYLEKHTAADTLDYAKEHGIKLSKKDIQKGNQLKKEQKLSDRTVDGKQVVWIEDNILKENKNNLPVHQYIADYISKHIGDVYTIIESGKSVYLGEDLPGEYTQSKYTQGLKKRKGILSAKNRGASDLGGMIEIATNRRWEKTNHTHNKDAKYGIYRYDTRFGFPVKDANGNVIGANIYTAELLIRNASNGKKYLYDVVNIKKDTTSSAWLSQRIARVAGNPATQKGNALYEQKAKNTPGVQFSDNILASEHNTTVAQESQDVKKFSERDPDGGYSNRTLLANALETTAQHEVEKAKLAEYKSKISLISEEQKKLSDLRAQIKDLSFTKGPRDTKRIKDLQFEANQIANRINTYDRQLLNLESTQALKNVLQREKEKARKRAEQKGKEALDAYKERAAKTQRELITKYQDSRKKAVENRNRTAMRHKVQNVVKDLNNYLLNGDKKHHVPVSLQKAVAEALNAVNMDTVGAEERIAKLQAQLAKAKSPDVIADLARKIENVQAMGDKMSDKLDKLSKAYEAFLDSDDPDIANAYDEVISNLIKRVSKEVGDTPLRDMTTSQLESVYELYKGVLTRVRDANKAFQDNIRASISDLVMSTTAELDALPKRKKDYTTSLGKAASTFSWNNEKPVYAFERIGSETLSKLYGNIRSGEDTWVTDVNDARDYFSNMKQKYGYDNWDMEKEYEFTSASGKNFSLTLQEMMSIYAYAKREADIGTEHLRRGGFIFDDNAKAKTKKLLGVVKMKVIQEDATFHKLSDELIGEIIGTMDSKQKGFVDEMQNYLSAVMGAKGNDVSMKMYGIKLFKEKFYFPLHVSSDYNARIEARQKGEVKIKNSGFTKEITPKSNAPIVLTPFMDVWADHVNEMSMYHAFVLPLEDFYRVYSTNSGTSEFLEAESVKQKIKAAHGSAATNYIEQFLNDLNGDVRSDPRETIGKALTSKFKKAAVFVSASVTIQQPSAIGRAFALIDPKFFVGQKMTEKRHKALWNELKHYAPIAAIKEMGYFDTNMGMSTRDYLLAEEYSGVKEKAKAFFTDGDYRDEILSKAPALADEVTWVAIWDAVKRETAANRKDLKVGSEEFLKAAGDRFTEVISKTQVYDSVFSRSANMRSKSLWMGMVTSFMAEPTTTINMVENAFRQFSKGDKKGASRAMASVFTSMLINSLLVSFVYAARDDDEEKNYLEKYLGTFASEMLDSMNPLTYFPVVKDVWSILQGYDVERADMTLIDNFADSVTAFSKLLIKDTSEMDEDELDAHYGKVKDEMWGLLGDLGSLMGLPIKNVVRDGNAVINLFKESNWVPSSPASVWDAVSTDMKNILPVVGWLPDESKTSKLYDAIVSGDKVYLERIKNSYDSTRAYDNAVKKAIRENDPRIRQAADALIAGDTDTRVRIIRSIVADGFSQDMVVSAVNAEVNSMQSGGTSEYNPKVQSLYTVEDYTAEVANGGADAESMKDEIVRVLIANGKTEEQAEESFASSVKSAVKEKVIGGNMNSNSAETVLVKGCGFEKEDAEETVQKWAFEAEHGFAYSDLADEYTSGNISASEVRTILMDVEGKTADEADTKMQYWQFKADYPDVYVDDSWFEKYNEEIAISGIPMNVYADYRNKVKSITGEGKKEQRMEVINSMPISSAQKDALYFSEGWAKSRLHEAPWH